jgi:xylulokinase
VTNVAPASDGVLVVGADSSTQSCKIVVCEAETGRIVGTGGAFHPAGSEISAEV